jgi:LacI family transcriptional regulator
MVDVSRAANVSVTTVSHVINRTRPVNPSTEQAVLSAVAATGYVPDNVARSLRSAGSQVVGLAMASMSNPYFGDVVHGIDLAGSRAGYSLLLADTHDDSAGEMRAISDLLSRQVDAIVLAPGPDPAQALQHARHQNVPVVLIDRLVKADVDQIGPENIEPTAQLVDHVAQIGHRQIAMITGRRGLSTSEERLAGYRLGLSRNKIRFTSSYVADGDSQDDAAENALLTLMNLPKPPTAVVVANNRMTIGAMRGARRAGIQIPRDLALVAYDDFEWAELFQPRLTTIAQPTRAMGKQAMELVLARLADPSAPTRHIVMRPTFVHRESCGCPPAGEQSPDSQSITPS